MRAPGSVFPKNKALVADNVVLDGRLALYHERDRWLAIADLHFGYELSRRAAGWLLPLWGMESIATRIFQLLDEYRPAQLIILGDLVHDGASAREARDLIQRLGERCAVLVIAGNHDRSLGGQIPFLQSWRSGEFYFHHGHCAADEPDGIQIIGHHHPAGVVRDGAGLRLKLPAFVQQDRCWILPAFSPWAGGTDWRHEDESRVWLCAPHRVFRLEEDAG